MLYNAELTLLAPYYLKITKFIYNHYYYLWKQHNNNSTHLYYILIHSTHKLCAHVPHLISPSLSFLVHFDNLMFYFTDIAALELVSAVLLLQQLKVSFDFALLLIIKLAFHAGEGGLLSLLRHSTFESLALNSLFEKRDLILVVGLDGVDHESVLHFFLLLGILVITLLLEKFVFLKLAS